jgi:hypothetical protein
MSSSISSIAGVSKIITRNQGGGDKKQGLAPTATFFFMAPYTGNNYKSGNNYYSRTNVNYQIGGAIPPLWYRYRTVGSTTIINGMRVFSN